MAITTNSLFDTHQLRIQEIINRNVTVFLAMLDIVWRNTIVTQQGVGNPNEIGRDLKVIKVFMGSFAGVLEQGEPYGDFDLYGDLSRPQGQHMHYQRLTQAYPSPLSGPNASPYRLAVSMRSMPANIMLTLGEKQLEATPATIGQVIMPKLMGFSRMLAHTLANYFYLSQNTNYQLCTVTNISAFTTVVVDGITAHRWSFEPNNQAAARFERGQRVDIYVAAATDRKNDTQSAAANQNHSTREPLLVESVNKLHNIVTLISQNDPTAWLGNGGANPVNTDVIVYANSKLGAGNFTGIAGINSWLKPGTNLPAVDSDNNLLLGTAEADATDRINVDVFPEFMSFLKAVNGPLTEHRLRQYLARVHASWDPLGKSIDCLVASDGVWTAYESQKIGQFRIDRTNRPSSLMNEGSQKGFRLTFDGRDYVGFTSHLVEVQTVYGLRKSAQNWKRYVPRSPAQTSKSLTGLEQWVPFEFVAGAITGTGSNQMPIYATETVSGDKTITLPTEGSQMPGRIRMQLIPDQPNMIKLTQVTEDRIYSDFGT